MPFRKSPDTRPLIDEVTPAAAIPGGEVHVRGKNFMRGGIPAARFGDTAAHVITGSDSLMILRVPDAVAGQDLIIGSNGSVSAPLACAVGRQIGDSMHVVANPAVDENGNVFTTLSGSRGQKTPVSVYRVDTLGQVSSFVSDITNATGLVFDSAGTLYISSRHEGNVYSATPSGSIEVYVEGMGIATGIAFDHNENLYVGDRSGTIFKVNRERHIYVFATLESSIAAYHLAFGPEGDLYVTGPTTSSYDSVHRITPAGDVEIFYRGLGRPQGLAFDTQGNLYVAASLQGRRGIVRITPAKEASLFLSGPGIVGLAFGRDRNMIVATQTTLFDVPVGVEGRRLA